MKNHIPALIALLCLGFTTSSQADWTTINGPDPNPAAVILNDIHFTSNAGWAVGLYGNLIKSTNSFADTNFLFYPTNPAGQVTMYDVYFRDDNLGFAGGDGGTLVRTTDGFNFSLIATPTTKRIVSIGFQDTSVGWAVAYQESNGDSDLIYTTDGGASWILYPDGTRLDGLRAVQVVSTQRRCFVGQNGKILNIVGGVEQPVSSGTAAHLLDVAFISTTTGYAVGTGGTIIKTTDGGDTWVTQQTPISETLHAVSRSSSLADLVYVVGENGTILMTEDGGANWYLSDSHVTSHLYGVSQRISPAGLAGIVGDDTTVLRTLDFGGTEAGIIVTEGSTVFKDDSSAAIGNAPVGSTVSRTFTVRNSGNSNLTISAAGTNGNVAFSMQNEPDGVTLTPGQTRDVTINFTPNATGAATGSFSFVNNAIGPLATYTVNISGNGLTNPGISLSEAGQTVPDEGNSVFGGTVLSKSTRKTFTITNTGTTDLFVAHPAIIGANSGDFTVSRLSTTLLSPSSTTTFTIDFAPLGAGVRTATMNMANDTTTSTNPYSLNLSGTGVTPSAPTIRTKRRIRTKRSRVSLRGSAADINGDLMAVTAKVGRRNLRVRGTNSWRTRRVRLRKSRTSVTISASDSTNLSSRRRVRIIRRS